MAKRETATPKTEQINFRLRATTIAWMEDFRDRHHLRPSLTNIVESALADWREKHKDELPPKKESRPSR